MVHNFTLLRATPTSLTSHASRAGIYNIQDIEILPYMAACCSNESEINAVCRYEIEELQDYVKELETEKQSLQSMVKQKDKQLGDTREQHADTKKKLTQLKRRLDKVLHQQTIGILHLFVPSLYTVIL